MGTLPVSIGRLRGEAVVNRIALIELRTSGGTVLATFGSLQWEEDASIPGIGWTVGAPPTNAVATGTVANARYKEGNQNIVVDNLSVGTSGAEVNISSLSVTDGQQLTLNSGVWAESLITDPY
jgi:hypothetical protein